MRGSRYLESIFDIVEYMIKTELLDSSKILIMKYVEGSAKNSMAVKARDAVTRYTQTDIPTLEEIRRKAKNSKLGPLDHLVLKMEFESEHFFE